MATERIEIALEAELGNLKKGFAEAQKLATDTKVQLDKDTLLKLELDNASLITAQKELRAFVKNNEKLFEDGLISEEALNKSRVALNRINDQVTESGRQLRNYRKTGDQELSRLGALFNSVNDEIGKTREELIKAGKSTAGFDKIADELKKTNLTLEESVNQSKKYADELDSLGRAVAKLDDDFAKGKITQEQYSKELQQTTQALDKTQKSYDESRKAVQKYNSEISGLKSDLKKVGTETEGLSNKIGSLTDTVKGFGIALAGAVSAVLIQGVFELEQAYVKLEAQIGSTNKNLEEYKAILNDLQATGLVTLGESVKIVSTLGKETNLSNEELRKTATGIATISNLFEKDFNSVLGANIRLQNNFGISGEKANDLIVSSLQKTGDTYDDLLDSIIEYSDGAAAAGVEVDKFLTGLNNGILLGIRNTDDLADAQRELGIRILDGSKKSTESVNRLNTVLGGTIGTYEDLLGQISRNEITQTEATDKILRGLLQVEDKVLQNQLAVDILGTKFEDNSIDIVTALVDVEGKLDDTAGATDRLIKRTNEGVGGLQKLWKSIVSLFQNELIPILNGASNVVLGLGKAFKGLFSLVNAGIGVVVTAFTGLVEVVTNVFTNIKSNLGVLVNNVSQLAGNIGDNVSIAFAKIPELLKQAINKALRFATDAINDFEIAGISLPKITFDGFDVDKNVLNKSFIGDFQDFGIKTDFSFTKRGIDGLKDRLQDFKGNLGLTKNEIQDTTTELESLGDKGKEASEKLGEIPKAINKSDAEKKLESENKILSTNIALLEEKIKTLSKSGKSYSSSVKESEKALEREKEAFEKNQKELLKIQEKTEKELQKGIKDTFEDGADIIDTFTKESSKNIEEFAKNISSAKEQLSGIQDALDKLDENRATTLGERSLEIAEREKEIRKELLNISNGQGSYEEYLKQQELQKELNDLIAEQSLIRKNITDEELAQAERIASLSPTAKFLEEQNIEKQRLELLKSSKEQEIKDLQEQKQSEEKILEGFQQIKINLEETYAERVKQLEQGITDDLLKQVSKREIALARLKAKAEEYKASLIEAGLSIPDTATAESSESNTSNNSNTYNITVNESFNAKATGEYVARQIAQAEKNKNKGIF